MKNKKIFVLLLGILAFAEVLFWAKASYVVPVIMYHNIDNTKNTSLSVSPESFERQIAFLKKYRYNVVSLGELARILKTKKIPHKTIAITFDDGYSNNYEFAYPILKKYNIKATIFISPALIGKDGYLTWGQVASMSDSGVISIGSHSMNHAFLPSVPKERLDLEMAGSKMEIEKYIKKEVDAFSYPIGGFNSDVRDMAIRSGYKIAVATNPGKKYPNNDVFAMKRLRISKTSDNLFVFWIETSGFYTWLKEHRDKD